MHPSVHRNTVYNSNNMEATYMAIYRWIDKDTWYTYKMENYSARKNEIMTFVATWISQLFCSKRESMILDHI